MEETAEVESTGRGARSRDDAPLARNEGQGTNRQAGRQQEEDGAWGGRAKISALDKKGARYGIWTESNTSQLQETANDASFASNPGRTTRLESRWEARQARLGLCTEHDLCFAINVIVCLLLAPGRLDPQRGLPMLRKPAGAFSAVICLLLVWWRSAEASTRCLLRLLLCVQKLIQGAMDDG